MEVLKKWMKNRKVNKVINIIIAIVASSLLWNYVAEATDPYITKTISNVPVQIMDKQIISDEGLGIIGKNNFKVTIEIRAKRSEVISLDQDEISVKARISDVKSGPNDIPINISSPPGIRIVETSLDHITLDLDKIVSEERPIKIVFDEPKNQPIKATSYEPYISIAYIEGPKAYVDEVKKIQGTIDSTGLTNDFSVDTKLYPVDKDGNVVKGVTLSTNRVLVDVKMNYQKEVALKVNTIGTVANGYKVGKINAPNSIKIYGEKTVLDSIASIETVPIDIEGLNETKKIKVPLNLDPRVKGVDGNEVEVEIKISNE